MSKTCPLAHFIQNLFFKFLVLLQSETCTISKTIDEGLFTCLKQDQKVSYSKLVIGL